MLTREHSAFPANPMTLQNTTFKSPFCLTALILSGALALASPAAWAQNAANGQSLYNTYCVSCHGFPPAAGPDRAGNNPALISAAIAGKVPDMRTLSFLSSANIADIAAWLGTLSQSGPPMPAFDYTDLWWNEAESGWGLNLIQHPSNNIFGVMYTYDTTGKPEWFVLPGGNWSTPTTFIGAWFRVTGPAFNGTFSPNAVNVIQVGNAQINFTDASHGTIAFSVNGTSVVKTISRQPF